MIVIFENDWERKKYMSVQDRIAPFEIMLDSNIICKINSDGTVENLKNRYNHIKKFPLQEILNQISDIYCVESQNYENWNE
jgi:hypothetical protein